MKRVILVSLALSLCGAVNAQQPQTGRYFTPTDLVAQMNLPNDQPVLLYLTGVYDRTQDTGRSCALRGTVTPVLLGKVVFDFLMAHPELASADRTAAGVAAQAFTQYWPCHAASQSPAAESLPTIPADLDSRFVCPEALSNDQARMDALSALFKGIAREVPGVTILDVARFRFEMLQKHSCQQTLQHMEAAIPPSSDEPGQKIWLPVQFDGSPGGTFAISDVGLVPVVDPRSPAEHAVNAYVKLMFPKPQETNVTHVTYDTVISHNIYYCGSARNALVENDYFLSGRQALRDPSPVFKMGSTDVYEVAPVRPGTPNAAALQPACRAIGVASAQMTQTLPGRFFTPDNLAVQTGRDDGQLAQIYLMGTYDLAQDAAESCAQRGTTSPVLLAKVYSDYITAHPELMHSDRTAAGIAAQAFAQYWPCLPH